MEIPTLSINGCFTPVAAALYRSSSLLELARSYHQSHLNLALRPPACANVGLSGGVPEAEMVDEADAVDG